MKDNDYVLQTVQCNIITIIVIPTVQHYYYVTIFVSIVHLYDILSD